MVLFPRIAQEQTTLGGLPEMELAFFKSLGPRALKLMLIAAAGTILIGLGFRTWRPEAALGTPEYILVFLICLAPTYVASRIYRNRQRTKKTSGNTRDIAERKE